MSSYVVVCVSGAKASSSLLNCFPAGNGRQRGLSSLLCRSGVGSLENADKFLPSLTTSSQERVKEMVRKHADLVRDRRRGEGFRHGMETWDLDEAYDRCLELATIDGCSVYLNKRSHHPLTLLLSSLVKLVPPVAAPLIKPDQMKCLAALLVWCRRTDELVDGINGCCATPEVLDKWEQRLVDLYEGRPHDMYDAALSHALSKYPIDLELFKGLIEGMRMDLRKKRYANFDELYLYMYHSAGTVATMLVQVVGTSHESSLESVYNGAIAGAISFQLTDILVDVVEDARLGRVYLPQDELAKAGISEEDLYSGKVTDKWRNFVKEQIKRAREYADESDKVSANEKKISAAKLLHWALVFPNRMILDKIEENDYDLTKPAPLQVSELLSSFIVASVRGFFSSDRGATREGRKEEND